MINNYKSIIEAWGAPKIARVYMVTEKEPVYGVNNSGDSILQLLGLLLLFIIILYGAVYVTKWLGKNGMGINQCRNINVIEVFRISQNQSIQIVKIADKYYALGISKEKVDVISTIDEDKINFEKKNVETVDFKELFEKVKQKVTKADKNEEKEE
ncbi:MAG: flagellar biosynthetic protein FliO [Lachnospiraceae bacterium]|nr:flagellar biosynthetic protein FliO [Lachnospiraceae bacterium]